MLSDINKASILVVEDDYCIRVLLEALLSPRFDVELASTFDEALQAAALKEFDLFLLDINLGETRTGFDLLVSLRQMPTGGSTLAVACTSFSGEENRDFILSYGFDEYLCKPFTRRQLLGVIERVFTSERLKSSVQRVHPKAVSSRLNAIW